MKRSIQAARRLGEGWALRLERVLDGVDPGNEVSAALLSDRALLASWLAEPKSLSSSSGPSTAFASEPARALVDEVKRLLLRRQQFLVIDEEASRRLEGIYERVFGELRALLSRAQDDDAFVAALDSVLALERRLLERFVAELPGARERTTCGEYSAELQLEVLGLTLEDFTEPVLDVGCGERANLVRWLVEHGIEAFGLERHAREARVIRGDWLEFDFGVHRFGTVVSHQAFSLHFLRHHLEPDSDLAKRYALTYRNILGSLRKNGRFVYAPGLPFLERLLPASFTVSRTPLPSPLVDKVKKAFAAIGEDVAYACHVSRR